MKRENTLYFKWDKNNNTLTLRCTKEDGTIFTDSRKYTAPSTIADFSEASSAQSKSVLKVMPILKQFAIKTQKSYDAPSATPSDKKEEGEVENVELIGKRTHAVKQAGSSPRVETQLSSSSLSFLALPKPLVRGSNVNLQSSTEGSNADSQPNSGRESPRVTSLNL